MHVLKRLAIDYGHFSTAIPIVQSSIYVDDMLFENDSIHELCEVRDQLIDLIKGGGFPLLK